MPANRSRTMHWRRCLEQIHQRGGAIEIAVARLRDEAPEGCHLVWRVRILDLTENELVVEQPMTLGQMIELREGVAIIAVMSIGQNRWTFDTQNLGTATHQPAGSRPTAAVRLAMPTQVQRCQRRNFARVETEAVAVPEVEIWPLLDPKTVIVAERANELMIDRMKQSPESANGAGLSFHSGDDDASGDPIMPELGPKFAAQLVNIGGGGIGLCVAPSHNQMIARYKLFWLRFAMPPELLVPICATAKLAHTHMQADQSVYAGLAFDFSFNAGHQRYVVDQICRFIDSQQRQQFAANAVAVPQRRSA